MPSFTLPNAGEILDLDYGYSLTADGVTGRVVSASAESMLSRSLQADEFEVRLELAGLRKEKVITLSPSALQTRALGDPPPTVTLEITHAPNTRTLLLVEDESGALHWQLPDSAVAGTGARDLAPMVSRFTVAIAPSAPGARGLFSKILKTFVYPLVDAILGPIVEGFARRWETRNRPYLVRSFRPDDYTQEGTIAALRPEQWQELAQGTALLWVHGTFSSAAAFAGIPVDVMRELTDTYGARSFAFNHFTLSADPAENARMLLAQIPAGLELEVDIVCHSRGGLVARELARLGMAAGQNGRLRVRRIVFVAAPNSGTALADDDHMVEMIDRFTTLVKFFPSPTAQKILEGAVTALKLLGHALLHDLPGLRAMNPQGPYLETLNVAGGTPPEHFAIAADFEPKAGEPLFSVTRLEDGVMDRVFTDVANDLVVPRDGVAASNGAPGFPIPAARQMIFDAQDGVIHTHFFQFQATYDHLKAWLTADGTRDLPQTRVAPRELSPGELSALRPHLVNLSEGKFKQSGKYYTSPEDVDAIFQQHLPAWRQQQPTGQPLRVVFFAHGGLVGEQDGLAIAQKHVAWWKRNGVYPIYFVWETGLFDAVRSILNSVASKVPGLGARDIWDYTTDPVVELGARALGGVKVWGAMKANARLASEPDGGAHYVAQRLTEFCGGLAQQGAAIELHAVGHSAGSIFHAHFLPAAASLGVPHFRTLQLLAPAIDVDAFKQRLLPLAGNAAGRITMYSMRRDYEEADSCISVYHKSLLYLIYNALESERKTPIVGLEQSARSDTQLRRLFGLDGSANPAADVVWSVTPGSGNSASQSTSHGGFDDDAATMSSVAARVLGLAAAPVPYTGTGARDLSAWPIATEWLDGFDLTEAAVAMRPVPAPAPVPVKPPVPVTPDPVRPEPSGTRLKALCVGIDAYPAPNTLAGCVNDAEAWGAALESCGYTVSYLRNEQASYRGITDALRALVTSAKPGDSLVFQYAGHGSELPDSSGDEDGLPDQAMVPVDFGTGAFLVDDDVYEILSTLPQGVRLTAFTDCCHSETNTRVLFSYNQPAAPAGMKARFLVPTPEQEAAHLRFRASTRALRTPRDVNQAHVLRWVAFAACKHDQKAYESNGHGAYTGHAVGLLSQGIKGVSNGEFHRRILAAFGSAPLQQPTLDCPPALMDEPLLGGGGPGGAGVILPSQAVLPSTMPTPKTT